MNEPIPNRPRRNRSSEAIRDLVRETHLTTHDLIYPVFVQEGTGISQEIATMPGIHRHSLDQLSKHVESVAELGIRAIALFPVLGDDRKDTLATESTREDGLMQNSIRELKKLFPELLLFTDVAMDPYSSDGHDGLVHDGKIVNDKTLPILAAMAVSQAAAGADIVAPSDMMDGRVAVIRDTLDDAGFTETGICSYSAKYASAFYGPFRDALDSAPRSGDKKTYQMDPANMNEAIREVELDIDEGADIVMVKPAGAYLDIISEVASMSPVPVAAYQVSGEYAMIKFASQAGAIDEESAMLESLTAIKRAGADMIFTYFAPVAARLIP
ncbi:MAG: porphobilinogen synthase [Proteobacteria bacterium]|nr:porphobilinogen synthase [Pseudomonadota bacterium]